MLQQNKHTNDGILLIGAVVLMTIALYARDLFGVNLAKLYLVALAVIPAFIMSYQSLVCFIFFLFPLTSGIPGNIIFPILIIVLLLKKRNSFEKNSLYCFLILVFMELIHYIFYSFGINWTETLGYFCNLFFLFYLISLRDGFVDNRKCLLFFCIGLAVFLLAIFFITQINGSVEMLLESGNRIGYSKDITDSEDVMMLNANPNGLGFFSVVGIATIMVLYSLRTIKFRVMILFSALYLFVGAMSLSRTFLICVVLLFALYGFFLGKTKGKKYWLLSLLFLVFIAAFFYYIGKNTLLYDAYTNRIDNSTGDNMGGRTDIFSSYNSYLLDNPVCLIFGTGAVHYRNVINTILVATHNGIQQILVTYGLIGLFFFIVITVSAVRKCYVTKMPICLLPFIIALFFVQSGQLLNPSIYLYLFIVSFYVMKLTSGGMNKINTERLT